MSVLPLLLAGGRAGALNACAVVLLLGVLGATGVGDEVPEPSQRTDARIAARGCRAVPPRSDPPGVPDPAVPATPGTAPEGETPAGQGGPARARAMSARPGR
ncbi:hypothetical protein [Streptomyces sp. t39]|uniref:hypothetical protein n=1 Tax=Streptomyces sp. t39 TaxID=1828156 RepID=UPI0016505512|nr:hypothetical protein [Streptomyces sp. t39]